MFDDLWLAVLEDLARPERGMKGRQTGENRSPELISHDKIRPQNCSVATLHSKNFIFISSHVQRRCQNTPIEAEVNWKKEVK